MLAWQTFVGFLVHAQVPKKKLWRPLLGFAVDKMLTLVGTLQHAMRIHLVLAQDKNLPNSFVTFQNVLLKSNLDFRRFALLIFKMKHLTLHSELVQYALQ